MTEVPNYLLTLDIVSLAEIAKISGPTLTYYDEDIEDPPLTFTNYDVTEEESILEITNGYAYSTANVTIIINFAFLSLNTYNSIFLDYNGDQREEFANITINAAINLDKFGKAQIGIKNVIVDTGAGTANGDVTVTVDDINGDPLLVNGVQSVQILTSI